MASKRVNGRQRYRTTESRTQGGVKQGLPAGKIHRRRRTTIGRKRQVGTKESSVRRETGGNAERERGEDDGETGGTTR